MKEFRSNIRSEHDRYAECEHHLALEESQLHPRLVVLAEKGGALPQKFSQLQLLPDTCTHGFQPSPR